MRICIVYDCLYPWTVGGAERWYRGLAESLGAAGHEVTYVTRRQWQDAAVPAIESVRVVAVAPGGPLYTESGRRRVGPPIRFGIGVFGHLLRRRQAYDVVHCSSFPYFSMLAVRGALARSPIRVFVDWLELWSPAYWQEYLGQISGRIGRAIQYVCVRLTPAAFAISSHTAERLVESGLRSVPVVLPGLYSGPIDVTATPQGPDRPLVLFAGRQIPEKRAHLLPAAVAALGPRLPEARGLVVGDGPERPRVLAEIARLGLEGRVEAPGSISAEGVAKAMRGATCLLLPSAREGYGLVVVESTAVGTPVVVVRAEDSAASDLIVPGVNGFIAESADPGAIADAICEVHALGDELRASTAEWFRGNIASISAEASVRRVLAAYEESD